MKRGPQSTMMYVLRGLNSFVHVSIHGGSSTNMLRRKPLWQLMPDLEVSIKGHALNKANKRKLWLRTASFKAGSVKQGGWELHALVTGGWGVRVGQQAAGGGAGAPASSSPGWYQAPIESKLYMLLMRLVFDVLYVPQAYRPMHHSEMSQEKDLALLWRESMTTVLCRSW